MKKIVYDRMYVAVIPSTDWKCLVSPKYDLQISKETWNSLDANTKLDKIYSYAHDKYKVTLEDDND